MQLNTLSESSQLSTVQTSLQHKPLCFQLRALGGMGSNLTCCALKCIAAASLRSSVNFCVPHRQGTYFCLESCCQAQLLVTSDNKTRSGIVQQWLRLISKVLTEGIWPSKHANQQSQVTLYLLDTDRISWCKGKARGGATHWFHIGRLQIPKDKCIFPDRHTFLHWNRLLCSLLKQVKQKWTKSLTSTHSGLPLIFSAAWPK